ncbi:hypothetical protein PC129_g12151 [Phytophthora cactorum]|uniref:Uncharacterized protein n=1 Tax=Phytophthora cactorum TaxID=29920 RepID=A0A8T1CJN8_9STRA|nr:hypothetical protein PC112_g14537 [Phytophthora cactorum]KAG2817039.1 hypothetical protein PC111_g12875 [Phytophthora cactorum]KAG2853512.1 hypothetical protein PC113_g14106 [Phytophthora cactorum]KAG2896322.1 hypothetical protein PC114_g15138 [Phytophthora cactorum]KAG2909455.1 hypothetical protein PC115_g13234 [Phytophthora cactorum]
MNGLKPTATTYLDVVFDVQTLPKEEYGAATTNVIE